METHPDVEAQDPIDEKDFSFPTFNYNNTSESASASAAYWKIYVNGSRISDENLVKRLIDNASSMIIMNSLFSTIIASFIIEVYKTLIPAGGNGQQTTDSPPSIAIRINVLLFFSLLLNIVSAVVCALIQQWCNEYLISSYPLGAPHERGLVRTYLFQGLRTFQVTRFIGGTQLLLHISVFLFFWAISDFFYTVNRDFGLITRYTVVAAAVSYLLASVTPLFFINSPYKTPITPPLRAAGIILRIIIRSPLLIARFYSTNLAFISLTGLPYYKGIHFYRARLYSIKASMLAEKLEIYAMKWLFTEYDFSDTEMDKFLEGLPGYMSSSRTKKDNLGQYLTDYPVQNRIREHFMTCATSLELSDDASTSRVFSCVKALLFIFKCSWERKGRIPDKLEESKWQRLYIRDLIDNLQRLCCMSDPTIALRASCVKALAVQGLLSQLVPRNWTTDGPQPHFDAFLLPIYELLFPYDNTDNIRGQLRRGLKPSDEEKQRMWNKLLHDGPLVNLTRLSQAIRRKEQVPLESLSFCWKTLDIVLIQLGTIHSEVSTRAQMDFDNLHENIRTYVHADAGGPRVRPLLDILDKVGRGRRLSISDVHGPARLEEEISESQARPYSNSKATAASDPTQPRLGSSMIDDRYER